MSSASRNAVAVLAMVAAASAVLAGQDVRGFSRGRRPVPVSDDLKAEYDGRFAFVCLQYGPAEWTGIFEDNDPAKRLLAIANYPRELGKMWECSDTGCMPVDLSNEAYKFGVNDVMHAMTH